MLAVLSGLVFGVRDMHELSCGHILCGGIIVLCCVSCGDVLVLWMAAMQPVPGWYVLRSTRRDVDVIVFVLSNEQLREWVSGVSTDG